MLDYFAALEHLHKLMRPRAYLEIGVFRGDSLRLAHKASICVGVDPQPLIQPADLPHCHLEMVASDEFFASTRPSELFGGEPVDLIFIDGLHIFECALRDFFNSEALAGDQSLIVVHDCLPQDAETASRERDTVHWTGDVWKLVLCLLDHRPDLELSIIDVPPSGLCLVRNLNPDDRTLRDSCEALVEEYRAMDFDGWQSRSAEVLRRTTSTAEAQHWSLWMETEGLRDRLAESQAQTAALLASSSWRLTAPLRWIGSLLRREEASPPS